MSSKRTSVQVVEAVQLKDNVPNFNQGDTVLVEIVVKEGDRERTQPFEGVVIGIKNRGLNSAFTVRKISSGVGVERTFQTHSPLIKSIKVKRKGKVRQSKLYYLSSSKNSSKRAFSSGDNLILSRRSFLLEAVIPSICFFRHCSITA